MFGQYLPGLPGVRATKTARHKILFGGGLIPDILPGGVLVDGTASRDPSNTDTILNLQAGMLMGKITATGLFAPSLLGISTVAVVGGVTTTLTAAAAVVTELVRRLGASGTFKLTGPPSANGVVVTETVTYSAASGTSITMTAPANSFISGSFIQPIDGSETPKSIIPDGFGIPIAEPDGTVVASVPWSDVPIAGMILAAQIIHWPSDTSLRVWIQGRLNDINGGKFVFDERYAA
jgi:hypothetical protein